MMARAVIYARCSTEDESQKDALIKQAEEGREWVRQKGWLLVDSYIESRSGTTTKGRTEYNRLYEDLLTDNFDIIVIKSQDRLMRNTKDWYLFVDRLCSSQKKLYIYIEQKFYSADDALITGIKAILAEEYSRELSKKSNNAHRSRQKNDGPAVLTSHTYGYRKMPDKSLVILEDEAAVKRQMYELCAAGFGTRTIASILREQGVLNRNGKPFSDSAILKMIHNPINKGTIVMNKKHYDFDSKKTLKVPLEEQYIYENKVPAIVSGELWERANQEIAKRAVKIKSRHGESMGRNQGKYHLSGKVYCGFCGNPYYRKSRSRYKDRKIVYEWKCKKYLETGRPRARDGILESTAGCDNVHLDEETLYCLLEEVHAEKYSYDREKIIRNMTAMLKKVLKKEGLQPEIERVVEQEKEIRAQMSKLADKLLEGILPDQIYGEKQKELEKKLQAVKKKLESLEQKTTQEAALQDRISEIESIVRQDRVVEKAGVAHLLDKIDRIIIFPEYMELRFGMGKTTGLQEGESFLNKADSCIRIEYGNLFHYKKQKQKEREVLIDWMRENPQITAKEIAKRLGISVAGVNYKIRVLKSQGRIWYQGKGGKGEWKVSGD